MGPIDGGQPEAAILHRARRHPGNEKSETRLHYQHEFYRLADSVNRHAFLRDGEAAIVGLTRTLAHELGVENIRVNCILPGAILTQRQKQLWFMPAYEAEILRSQAIKRMIHPEEVARLVLFLAADDSGAITHQSYVIDGGWV
jgi:NAD(P)-dependent dehydrogenase (short-subunit alcohol dehydrogenase family)